MIELQHKSGLFAPPKGTTAIVVPCSGEVGANAEMKFGFALQAAKVWPSMPRNLGVLTLGIGNIPHPITRPYITPECPDGYIGMPRGEMLPGLPVDYHVITFPVRVWNNAAVNDDLVSSSARQLARLCRGDNKEIWWLRTGKIVLPRFECRQHDWKYYKGLIGPWLADDRFVVVPNKGTRI